MVQSQIDFDAQLGRILRDEGMAQVSKNAGEWSEAVRRYLDIWFNETPQGAIFTGEDIRLELQDVGVDEPHHANAWSAVIGARIRTWLKTGQIQIDAWKAASDPKAHARRMIAYRKVG